MDIKKAEKRVNEIENEMLALKIESNNIMREVAEQECPFKVGDYVTNREDGPGRVFSISPTYFRSFGLIYSIKMQKIKKNGDLYKNATTPWSIKKLRLMTAQEIEETLKL